MDLYLKLRQDTLNLNHCLADLFSRIKALPSLADPNFESWEKTSRNIDRQLTDEILRVAVVGAIKSGKSTFINALFGGDYLKRGAGVVTSIVTRIRKGPQSCARLRFKSWEAINADMEQAMVLLPALDQSFVNSDFDIRKPGNRDDLQAALGKLGFENLISNDTRNVNALLLTSYLRGYNRVKDLVSAKEEIKIFKADTMAEHKKFVGDEDLAVFLKDVQLEIDTEHLGDALEFADCQGSDSPNPLHLAMIQDYLLSTHFLVYVISSRTGLRQADIRFLNIIKQMGILENMLFVVNCDFNEHENQADLDRLVGKIASELSLIRPDSKIYAISALLNLFRALGNRLPEKDRGRLDQWENEGDLIADSDRQTRQFMSALQDKITRGRYSLLLRNHVERIHVITTGLRRWIEINQQMLGTGTKDAQSVMSQITARQKRLDQIKAMIKTSLDGALGRLKSDIKNDVDRFFDARSGEILPGILTSIQAYQPCLDQCSEKLVQNGFYAVLYEQFQEFRQTLDAQMVESVNPRIIRFVRQTEAKIKQSLESIIDPFDTMAQDALQEYETTLNAAPGAPNDETTARHRLQLPDMNAVKQIIGLELPPAQNVLRYSARVKTEAGARLGWYRLLDFMKKLCKQPVHPHMDQIRALRHGINRLKSETEQSVRFHIKDYQENLKFQYLFKLADLAGQALYEALMDRFQAYETDFNKLTDLMNRSQAEKAETAQALDVLKAETIRIISGIDGLRRELTAIEHKTI